MHRAPPTTLTRPRRADMRKSGRPSRVPGCLWLPTCSPRRDTAYLCWCRHWPPRRIAAYAASSPAHPSASRARPRRARLGGPCTRASCSLCAIARRSGRGGSLRGRGEASLSGGRKSKAYGYPSKHHSTITRQGARDAQGILRIGGDVRHSNVYGTRHTAPRRFPTHHSAWSSKVSH